MNGLEALEELKNIEVFVEDDSWCGCTCYYPLKDKEYQENFKSIEKELKVLQILREKKVDLKSIEISVHNKYNKDFSIETLLWHYNDYLHNIPLTKEEMTFIVEWLKEE